MSDNVQQALINLLSGLCGAIIGGASSFIAIFITNLLDRRQRRKERLIQHNSHNIQKIEAYLDARISKIKSLTRPHINTNTLIDHFQSELSKEAGSSDAARAAAKLLGDKELATYLADLENIFLTIWDLQKQATKQQDFPELEEKAIDIYDKCAVRVEALKQSYLTSIL